MIEQKAFPKFDKHVNATCFHCAAFIGKQDKPLFYGFPRGAYGMWCHACNWRTYYDTPDATVKFDAKGDPIDSTCSCGCVVPYADWPVQDYSGYQSCPDCGMV
jgi:hypothetical protein